jgi:hypothetical protein
MTGKPGLAPYRLHVRSLPMRMFLAPAAALVAILSAGAAMAAPFHPLRFFEGRTESDGRVKVALSAPHGLKVHGHGRVQPDGTLILDQTVEEEGKPVRMRHWQIKEVSPGQFAGTISDAVGTVKAESANGKLHLRFKMKEGGYAAEQWLTPSADGSTLQNSMTVKKFGITVATVEETIRRVK